MPKPQKVMIEAERILVGIAFKCKVGDTLLIANGVCIGIASEAPALARCDMREQPLSVWETAMAESVKVFVSSR